MGTLTRARSGSRATWPSPRDAVAWKRGRGNDLGQLAPFSGAAGRLMSRFHPWRMQHENNVNACGRPDTTAWRSIDVRLCGLEEVRVLQHARRMLTLLVAATLAADPSLKFMAFNVLYKGADDAASIAAIEKYAPDVLCLSELTPAFIRAFDASPLAKLYAARRFEPTLGTWGIGIASKFPIQSSTHFSVPPLKLPAVEAVLNVRGRAVNATCVHLNPPAGKHRATDGLLTTLSKNDAVRKKQADFLVAHFGKTSPLVLLGDFNEQLGGEAMKTFERSGLTSSCAGHDNTRCGATFPGPAVPKMPAVFQIDHILGRGVCFSRGAVLRAGGSDHYPVTAELQLGTCVEEPEPTPAHID